MMSMVKMVSICLFFLFLVSISFESSLASHPNTIGIKRKRHLSVVESIFIVARAGATGTSTSQSQRIVGSSSTSNNNNDLSIAQRLVAGGASRGIAQMVLYPVDALRTLAQTRDGRTLKDVGGKALIRGCAQTSSFALFIGSIQFAIFGATRDKVGPVVASALGAAGSCIVSVPQEVIKQRLVTGVYSNFRGAVKTIYSTEGIKGFYSAWQPTAVRNIPFVVATFTSMDILKSYSLECKKKKRSNSRDSNSSSQSSVETLDFFENMAIGICSSMIGATLTHPADVIKTRMMTQAASKAIPYTSTVDCIQTILREEGLKSFYSGFLQRSVYMGPLWAIQFGLNGKFTNMMKKSPQLTSSTTSK